VQLGAGRDELRDGLAACEAGVEVVEEARVKAYLNLFKRPEKR